MRFPTSLETPKIHWTANVAEARKKVGGRKKKKKGMKFTAVLSSQILVLPFPTNRVGLLFAAWQ